MGSDNTSPYRRAAQRTTRSFSQTVTSLRQAYHTHISDSQVSVVALLIRGAGYVILTLAFISFIAIGEAAGVLGALFWLALSVVCVGLGTAALVFGRHLGDIKTVK